MRIDKSKLGTLTVVLRSVYKELGMIAEFLLVSHKVCKCG